MSHQRQQRVMVQPIVSIATVKWTTLIVSNRTSFLKTCNKYVVQLLTDELNHLKFDLL